MDIAALLDDDINGEMISVNPDYIFLNIGTNGGGTTADVSSIITKFTNAGINVIPTLIVNGGNPATGGTFNNYIATTYPSTYIDTWTTGWNTMSVGNGDMGDALHPTTQGMRKLALIIKSARPDLFPN